MNCHHCSQLLSAYLDRELSPSERALVRGHLYDCPTCADELSHLTEAKELLATSLRPEPPVGFEDRVLSAVRQDAPQRFFAIKASPVLLVCAAAVIGIGFFVVGQPRSAPPAAPAVADRYSVTTDQTSFATSDVMAGGVPVVQASYNGN